MWLTYGGVAKALVGYADADGSMSEDCKAISYTFLVNSGAISWSAKQLVIVTGYPRVFHISELILIIAMNFLKILSP